MNRENTFDDFIGDLMESDIADLNAAPAKRADPKFARKVFTCEACNGTGRWVGGFNRHGNAQCHTCHGRGTLVTDPKARAKARAASANRKARVAAAAQEQNEATGLVAALTDMIGWNDFARSLVAQNEAGRAWSEAQVAAAQRMIDKAAASRAAKEQAKAEAPSVDLEAIVEMFETAMASGYKKPMYRALGLRIKPGRDGSLYVMTEDRMEYGTYGEQPGYEGKIVDGKFHAVRAAAEDTPAKLAAIAADPRGEAVRHGQRTGTCACCGRPLQNHASIDAGIGPVCAQKWGF